MLLTKKFLRRVLWNSTKNVHLKLKHSCDVCDKQFSGKSHLEIHKKSVHLKLKHRCDVCDKQFSQKNNLESHKKSIHLKLKQYMCDVCDKTDFQNLHFEGGLQYTPMLKMCLFSVVRDNLSHLQSWGHQNLAQGLYLDPF